MTSAERGPFGRAWDAWVGFWFRPTDPTPLCFMRIVAGLLTLYVHIAYSLDLESFFGAKAWYDRPLAERAFREYPIFVPEDPDKPIEHFPMPSNRELRATLREVLDNIKKKPENLRVLEMLMNMPPDNSTRLEVMRYIRGLPLDLEERDAVLAAMVVADPKDEKTANATPEWVQKLPRNARESFRADIHRFYEVMPNALEQRTWMWFMLEIWPPHAIELLRNMVLEFDKRYPDPAAKAAAYDYLVNWGVAPYRTYSQGHRFYSPFYYVDDPRILWLVHGLHLLVIFLFTIGFCTRVTSVLTWFTALAYLNRNPIVLFGQDTMMNLCLFYLMMAPCGAVWSVDSIIARYRKAKQSLANSRIPSDVGPTPMVSAGFVIRMLQVHYCLMYMSAGLSKLKGNSWWNGTAPWYTMNNPEFSPVHITWFRDFLSFLCQNENRVLWEAYMTFGVVFTLVVEIGFPFGVWTRLRPVFVAGAIILHTMIALNMGLIMFSLFMSALLICWLTPESIRAVFGRPPTLLPKLRLRFSGRSEPQRKAASLVYALDVWNQVELQDRGENVEVITDSGSQSGLAGLRESLRNLSLTRPWMWLAGPLINVFAGKWFANAETTDSRKPVGV